MRRYSASRAAGLSVCYSQIGLTDQHSRSRGFDASTMVMTHYVQTGELSMIGKLSEGGLTALSLQKHQTRRRSFDVPNMNTTHNGPLASTILGIGPLKLPKNAARTNTPITVTRVKMDMRIMRDKFTPLAVGFRCFPMDLQCRNTRVNVYICRMLATTNVLNPIPDPRWAIDDPMVQ